MSGRLNRAVYCVSQVRLVGILLCSLLLCSLSARGESGIGNPEKGAGIYKNLCAECHGKNGGGVPDEHEEPLVGDKSVESLAEIIHRSMPEDASEKCEGQDAKDVARYVYDSFYSKKARARNNPAEIELSRLTVRQYRNAVADLVGSFVDGSKKRLGSKRGLKGSYHSTRRLSKKSFSFERVDPNIRFEFGQETPDPEDKKAEDFAIRWRGSVMVEETGKYEFIVKSENGFKLWVNSSDEPLIDGWVVSGGESRTRRETIRLLGGRAYPIRVDYFKYKDESASIDLRWKPPHKVEATIPQRQLIPRSVPSTLVVDRSFPPDDSSVGYPRGTSVSKAWIRATTFAAVEVASAVAKRLNEFADTKDSDPKRRQKIKAFCRRFVEKAFRRPLSETEERAIIDSQFKESEETETAVKRVVLMTLKSPRFLYLDREPFQTDSYDVASRLSFGIWDSLPDKALWRAAEQGQLSSPGTVALHARRMLRDRRAKSKLKAFFHHWLKLNQAHSLAKDDELFPKFDKELISDLRTSLDLFIDDILSGRKSNFRQLLLADEMYLNSRIAEFLGKDEGAPKEGFEKRSFDPKERAGVLTHPYLLAAFSYRDNTSPIHRGVFVTRQLLGRTLNPPPEAVEFKDSEFDPDLTMREKVAELTKADSCQNCHSVINPLGFSLEHYDAVGRFRNEDERKRLNAVSKYEGPDGNIETLTGARDLAEYIANDEQAQRGFIIQLFNWIVKQPVQAFGAGMLDELHAGFKKNDYDIRRLIVEIAKVSALRELKPGTSSESSQLAEATK